MVLLFLGVVECSAQNNRGIFIQGGYQCIGDVNADAGFISLGYLNYFHKNLAWVLEYRFDGADKVRSHYNSEKFRKESEMDLRAVNSSFLAGLKVRKTLCGGGLYVFVKSFGGVEFGNGDLDFWKYIYDKKLMVFKESEHVASLSLKSKREFTCGFSLGFDLDVSRQREYDDRNKKLEPFNLVFKLGAKMSHFSKLLERFDCEKYGYSNINEKKWHAFASIGFIF